MGTLRLSARCTMVAKRIKSVATSAGSKRQKKGQMQTSVQEEAEGLGVHPGYP